MGLENCFPWAPVMHGQFSGKVFAFLYQFRKRDLT